MRRHQKKVRSYMFHQEKQYTRPFYLTMNLASLGFLLLQVLGTCSGSPTPPSQDPFYALRPGFEETAPGAILDYRKAPYPFQFPLPESSIETYQILYRTTDSFGNPTGAVTTIFIPPNADYNKIFVYLALQNTACRDCPPSYTLTEDYEYQDVYDEFLGFGHALTLCAALNQGWITTMPDFEGLKAAFQANVLGAQITLDSIRAALASANFTNVSSDAGAGILGFSGSSSSALFAAELQESYAPELKIVGVTTGSLVPNLEASIRYALPVSDIFPQVIYGLANEYSIVEENLNEYMVDDVHKRNELAAARKDCFGPCRKKFHGTNYTGYFTTLDFINSTTILDIIHDNSPGKHAPKIPLMIFEAGKDDISPVSLTEELISFYCDGGTVIDYRKGLLDGHAVLAVTWIFSALEWLDQRLEGIPSQKFCTNSTHVSAVTDPATTIFLADEVITFLERVLGDGRFAAIGSLLHLL